MLPSIVILYCIESTVPILVILEHEQLFPDPLVPDSSANRQKQVTFRIQDVVGFAVGRLVGSVVGDAVGRFVGD